MFWIFGVFLEVLENLGGFLAGGCSTGFQLLAGFAWFWHGFTGFWTACRFFRKEYFRVFVV